VPPGEGTGVVTATGGISLDDKRSAWATKAGRVTDRRCISGDSACASLSQTLAA
jgi:hypothetical protein